MDPQSTMSGTAEIGVQMHMSGTSGDDWCWKKARLNVLVGSIRHNILSITSLADSGWRFTQGPKGFDLFHEKLGMHCLDVAYFANCPWVRLYPDVGSSSAYRSDLTVSNTHDFSVAAVSGGDDNELARHRRQGHIPFNPNCLECAKGRSVFQHRRDKGDRKEVSIQADFAFPQDIRRDRCRRTPRFGEDPCVNRDDVKVHWLCGGWRRCRSSQETDCCMASTFWVDFEGSLH